MRLTPLRVDGRGAVVAALPAGPCGVLLTPAHQYPLGAALAAERRREVAGWAARTGGVVIEDDYDGEFRYDRQAVSALQPLAPEHIVYAGTASKSLAPGLRLGWLALPERLAVDVAAAKLASGRLSSSLDQLTLAELIRSGGYDRQVRRARFGTGGDGTGWSARCLEMSPRSASPASRRACTCWSGCRPTSRRRT
jgi:GntR family transcriptional regulator / MocR family aminotransferase